MKSIVSLRAQETAELGRQIAENIKPPFSIALTGELGTGKTTLIQGLARGLGVDKSYYITSPTYNIINEYPAGEIRLCHLDLYRLGSVDELEYIGFDDLLDNGAIIAVEWPGLLKESGFEFDLEIRFEFDAGHNRTISFFPSGHTGLNLLSRLVP